MPRHRGAANPGSTGRGTRKTIAAKNRKNFEVAQNWTLLWQARCSRRFLHWN